MNWQTTLMMSVKSSNFFEKSEETVYVPRKALSEEFQNCCVASSNRSIDIGMNERLLSWLIITRDSFLWKPWRRAVSHIRFFLSLPPSLFPPVVLTLWEKTSFYSRRSRSSRSYPRSPSLWLSICLAISDLSILVYLSPYLPIHVEKIDGRRGRCFQIWASSTIDLFVPTTYKDLWSSFRHSFRVFSLDGKAERRKKRRTMKEWMNPSFILLV